MGPWVNGWAAERLVYSANVLNGYATVIAASLIPDFVRVLVPPSLDYEYRQGRLWREAYLSAEKVLDALASATPEHSRAGGRDGHVGEGPAPRP